MDDDGSNLMLLTDTQSPAYPRWSPDSNQIVVYKTGHPR